LEKTTKVKNFYILSQASSAKGKNSLQSKTSNFHPHFEQTMNKHTSKLQSPRKLRELAFARQAWSRECSSTAPNTYFGRAFAYAGNDEIDDRTGGTS
jgi:hypothetical protein